MAPAHEMSCGPRLAASRKRMLWSTRPASEAVGPRELMEEIRGEGGKHVLKYGPGNSSNTRRAVVTAAGMPGGARGPQKEGPRERRGGWSAQARASSTGS